MDILSLKVSAKKQIKGSIPFMCAYFAIFAAISALAVAANIYAGSAVVILLIAPVFLLSFSKICLGFTENKKPSLKIIKDGFFRYSRNIITVILLIGYTIGWLQVFILPLWFFQYFPYLLKINHIFETPVGEVLLAVFCFLSWIVFYCGVFIKLLSYPMTFFVLNENIYVSSDESIRRSKEIMKNRKKEFCKLLLSFAGWFLLVIVTGGIASVYVLPYYRTTVANYYHAVKGEIVNEVYIPEKY